MTEYDYSPAAWQAHLAKQTKIDEWRRHNALHQPVNPFIQSHTINDSDFYKKRRKKKKSKKGKGHESEDEWEYEPYEGPDRPPTPPASAPVSYPGYPGGFAPLAQYGGGLAVPQQQPAYQYQYQYPQQQQAPQGQPFHLVNSNTGALVPVWTGSCWVYQQQGTSSGSSDRKHRRKRSSPAALSLPMANGSAQMISYYQQQPQPQSFTGQPVRQPYSASLPAMSGLYIPSTQTSPASGAYTLPQPYSAGVYQMPVAQIGGVAIQQPQSAGAYGTVIMASNSSKKHRGSDGGSSFFGKLRRGKL
ncbi:hypothetical protein FA15DRAFT_704493 [Coprinopsis marcescibilis]|uniref:Uncharacterized protein n=1 Tax=Coprinopsis marcescibilis TaxID=230819 RepID=A0A5C3KVR0_COPMA|nr:hypothetical protein FA15DRAFT_704493 [Coprinopsis marcescibilis]